MGPSDMGRSSLIDALRRANTITALTGAGVSAASGIPTFRGADGLYKNVSALSLATPEAFEQDPKLVWEWYDWRRQKIQSARPNAAHEVLAAWTRARPGVTVITQNVDGLHERAGTERLIRLHGSIWHVRCWNRCGVEPRGWRDDTVPFPSLPPRCPHCGGLVRPGVVWFGETLDPADISAASAATHCDVFLTIGTSSIVHPAAGLAHQARRHGAITIEINPDITEASSEVQISIRGRAEEVLLEIKNSVMGQ
jgi:NAD-dependent deacetylase